MPSIDTHTGLTGFPFPLPPSVTDSAPDWNYSEAFQRNEGLVSQEEQAVLKGSRVAIAGMGGVGGIHLITLARMGIGKFTIADPDVFDVANTNRQEGATVANHGRSKVEVMAHRALQVNPELDLKIYREPVSTDNVDEFLDGADVFLDGVDFFSIGARRLLFSESRRRGIWSLTAGPVGFSTAWIVFDPAGMSFDRYFDLCDSQSRLEQLIAFGVGLAPRATQRAYMDIEKVDASRRTAPSLSLACQLAAGVAAAEISRILLRRVAIRSAPWYAQFDANTRLFRQGRLLMGNRHPLQRLKRWYLRRRFGPRFDVR